MMTICPLRAERRGQSTGVSALASVLPKKSQGWSPSEWTGWISLQSKGLSRVFSNTTVQSLDHCQCDVTLDQKSQWCLLFLQFPSCGPPLVPLMSQFHIFLWVIPGGPACSLLLQWFYTHLELNWTEFPLIISFLLKKSYNGGRK